MHQLLVVSGPNRGTQFALHEGETSIGRQAGNGVVLPSSKVSKRHCTLVVSNGDVLVQDQGSSNGTFVNGILAKQRKLKMGDRISVGEYVLELVQPKVSTRAPSAPAALRAPGASGQVIPFPGGILPSGGVHSAFGGAGGPMGSSLSMGASNVQTPSGPPKDLKGRIFWFFENRFMAVFYSLNFKNEWRTIVVGLAVALLLGNVVLSVYPLLEAQRQAVVKEAAKRAVFMAKQIADRNAPYLAARAETKTELGLSETADGVRVAALTDLDLRILAPAARLNQVLGAGPEGVLAARLKERFRGDSPGVVREVGGSVIVAIEPVRVLSSIAGRNITVGLAIVSIDTSSVTLDFGEMGVIYSETLVMTGLLSALIFLILYRMTLKPFEVLNEDMDKALKGEIPQVTREFKMEEMSSLWEIINSAIQRIPRNGTGGDSGGAGGGLTPDDVLGPIRMVGSFPKVGAVAFDGDRKIVYLSPYFEEISGIRSENAMGQDIASVAREQSLNALIEDMIGRAMPGTEGVSEQYDFSGVSHRISVAAFGSGVGASKCFLLTAIKNE